MKKPNIELNNLALDKLTLKSSNVKIECRSKSL